jgi:hypothetical protein
MGFFHVRIAGLLSEAGISSQARDHLGIASGLFRSSSNQSSGLLQMYLAYAALDSAAGKYEAASAAAQNALTIARSLGMWRGELQSLGYLLVIHLRTKRLRNALSAISSLFLIIKGAELRRNSVMRLLVLAPLLLIMTFRRLSRKRHVINSMEKISTCLCAIHLPK